MEKAKKDKVPVKQYLDMLMDDNGNYDIAALHKAGLDEIVIYRIPTQAKNSMLVAKIVDFLPPEAGSSIAVPPGIVAQSGSDFDIDKVYIEMSNFNVRKGAFRKVGYESVTKPSEQKEGTKPSKQAQQNFIVDYHKAILLHPATFIESIMPNTADELKRVAKLPAFAALNSTDGAVWSSLRAQETFRSNNKAGKELIAFFSLVSVGYSVAPKVGLRFKAGHEVIVGGRKVEFTEEAGFYTEGSKLKSVAKDVEEGQTASVDNAKDPVLGRLNVSTFTAPVVALALQAGVGIETSVSLVNNEAIRYLGAAFESYSRTLSRTGAMTKALADTTKRFGLNSSKYKMTKDARIDMGQQLSEQMSIADIKGLTVQGNQEIRQNALNLFLYYEKMGSELYATYVAMNDSGGAKSTASRNLSKYQKIAELKGTLANRREQTSDSLLTEAIAESSLEVIPELYDKHFTSAYERDGIHKPLEILKKVSSSITKPYLQALDAVKQYIRGVDENTKIKIQYDFDTFLATNPNATTNTKNSKLSKMMTDTEYVSDMLFASEKGDFTLAAMLDLYKDKVRLVNKVLPEFTGNKFTEFLSSEYVDKGTEDGSRAYRKIIFNSSMLDATSSEEKEAISNYISDLIDKNADEYYNDDGDVIKVSIPDRTKSTAGNPVPMVISMRAFERALGNMILNYNFATSGFGKTINTFTSILPFDAHVKMAERFGGVNSVEFFRSIEDQSSFNPAGHFEFAKLFMRNNPQLINDSVETTKEISGVINANRKRTDTYLLYDMERGEILTVKGTTIKATETTLGKAKFMSEYSGAPSIFAQKTNTSTEQTVTKLKDADVQNKSTIKELKATTKSKTGKGSKPFIESQVKQLSEEEAYLGFFNETLAGENALTVLKEVGVTKADLLDNITAFGQQLMESHKVSSLNELYTKALKATNELRSECN